MPARPLTDDTITALVADATAAPSLHNAQPWRFRYNRAARTFRLRADLARSMEHTDPHGRALHIGCGAALLNLRVAVAHAGWRAVTELLPESGDPGLLATVQLTAPEPGGDGLARLHGAISRRHTSRRPFEERDIPPDVRNALRDAAALEGARLEFPGPEHVHAVLETIREAEDWDYQDRDKDEDLARWTHLGPGTPPPDGVPEYAFGPRRSAGAAPVRDFAGRRAVADRPTARFERTPHLALLSTLEDRPVDWLRAGQALERVLLVATAEGLASSFATQPVERDDLRWLLRDPVHGRGVVQMVLRLGYGPPGPWTPRRPLRDVLDIEP